MMQAFLAGVFLLALGSRALAAGEGCAAFKWPLAQESQWFTAANIPAVETGASFTELPASALAVTLVDGAKAGFVLPPERKPKDVAPNGAVLQFNLPEAAAYQITLSEEAWLDVVQNGAFKPSADFSGAKGCPNLRKSVRFALDAGPATVQISGASATHVLVAVRKAE
ncbi:hypothetical protein [Aestuariivirga sp.]|uniref:hypothetical protein n=1 Tax=Aestuariivirga sp. TaxID=2650926 RepID=UPI0039E2D277